MPSCNRISISILWLSTLAAPLLAQPSIHLPFVPDSARIHAGALATTETTAEKALSWWLPQRGVWTPIGWKDHLFRFTVPYNGALICPPAGMMYKPHTAKYDGRDFQLTFTPGFDGQVPALPCANTRLYRLDGGIGDQGWKPDTTAPVVVTRFPLQEGVVLKQEIFAHMQGGDDVTTALKPLYAWVRTSVDYIDPIEHPERVTMAARLSRAWYVQSGSAGQDEICYLEARPNLAVFDKTKYTSAPLTTAAGSPGLEIRETSGVVRLQVLPGGDANLSLVDSPEGKSIVLRLDLPAREGAHVDMLVPMLSAPADLAAQEAALGFDGALAQANAYWSRIPATAARIHVPEPYINQALMRNVQFAQIIAELNPDNGEYSFLSGSYGYDALWSTPTSMISHMLLDLLGYHDVVAKHITLYKANQGSVKPPGDAYELHPGYFSTPKTLTSLDWLGDHGAIMEIIGRHALLTGDKAFEAYWTEPVIKACEFIQKYLKSTNHAGVKGIMPPAIATDSLVAVQATWTQVWCYKGLETCVQFLKAIKHPRAAEFDQVRQEFQTAFKSAYEEKIAGQPTWKHPDGRTLPVLPEFFLAPPDRHYYDHAFLLDTGPLSLPWANLFDAADPRMTAWADYFRVGPPTKLWGPRSSSVARAILIHEISTCEPCYSFNIVNSWKTGDRDRFLEGMYALFTGAISPQTFINCEHRNNMYGTMFVGPLMAWCMRQAIVDDQLEPGTLHLLRLCPLAWVNSAEDTVFEQMPTNYGPVDLRWRLSADGKNLDVKFTLHWRTKPGQVKLHCPSVPGLETLTINGTPHSAGEAVIVNL